MGKNRAKRRRSPTRHRPHRSHRTRPSNSTSPPPANLPPKLTFLCSLIAKTPSITLESTLKSANIFVTKPEVEQILALSYAHPTNAITFFRWSGWQLDRKHTTDAWNLVVDLLGKNCMFDAMWDTIKSMESNGIVSLVTFSSVFGSYVVAGREKDAISAFDKMGRYGVSRDVRALNSLLSALCREKKTEMAVQFMRVAKESIRPDGDTFGVLLEGLEIEGDVVGAKVVFEEMVVEVGWERGNVAAYDSFLISLLKGNVGLNEAMKFFEVLTGRGCYPGVRFLKAAMEECIKSSDVLGGLLLWETLVGKVGLKPDTGLYNSLMALYCLDDGESARVLVDEMVSNGVFPDAETYNILLKFFISSRMLNEISAIFNEIRKNGFIPDQENCSAALRVFLDAGDPYMAIMIWKCMLELYESNLEESGNFMLVRLHDQDRLQEAAKFAGIMFDRGINVDASTLSKLKGSLCNLGKASLCERFLVKPET